MCQDQTKKRILVQTDQPDAWTGAVHLEMESFKRRDFVIWQGAYGDAAQAPLAMRNAVQGAKSRRARLRERPEA